jgi:hypothetical protein
MLQGTALNAYSALYACTLIFVTVVEKLAAGVEDHDDFSRRDSGQGVFRWPARPFVKGLNGSQDRNPDLPARLAFLSRRAPTAAARLRGGVAVSFGRRLRPLVALTTLPASI